jgi:hypothetical protein
MGVSKFIIGPAEGQTRWPLASYDGFREELNPSYGLRPASAEYGVSPLTRRCAPTSPRIRLRPKAGFGGQERGEVKGKLAASA